MLRSSLIWETGKVKASDNGGRFFFQQDINIIKTCVKFNYTFGVLNMSDFRGRKKGKWGKKENEFPSSATMSVSYDNASSGQRASTFSPSPSTSKSTQHNDTASTQVTSGIHSQKYGSKLTKKPKNGPSVDAEMSCKYFSKGRKRKFPPNKKHWKSYFNNKPKEDYTERNHTDEVPSTSYGSASKSNDHKELDILL